MRGLEMKRESLSALLLVNCIPVCYRITSVRFVD